MELNLSRLEIIEKLIRLFPRKTYDKQILEVLVRSVEKLNTFEILEAIREATGQDSKVAEAENLIRRGFLLSEALYRAGLISEDLKTYLASVEKMRTMPEFLKEKRRIDTQVKKIQTQAKSSLFIPTFSFLIAIGVIYIVIYFLYPKIEDAVSSFPDVKENLPFYFEYIDLLSKNPEIFYAVIGIMIIFFLYIYKNVSSLNIPFISKAVLEYQKLFFYAHLYLSFVAHLTEKEALEKYRGGLENIAKSILRDMESGVPIVEAFLENLRGKIDTIERAMIISALTGSKGRSKELANGFKDLYEDKYTTFSSTLENLKNYISVLALFVVGSIVLFIYIGLLLPMITVFMDAIR